MKVIVVTGSTRGIGFALADSLLRLGCSVAVSGRTDEGVGRAANDLSSRHDRERVFGSTCDVRHPGQLQTLWDRAKDRFGPIDIWINNAGLSGRQMSVWRSDPVELKEVVDTNLLGVIYGSQVAVRGMLEQGAGSIYNMEGMGADGGMHEGVIPYGMTKYGVHYFTKGLAREAKGTPLIVGSIRPGMVATEMLTAQYRGHPEEWERVRRIFNILANRPEVVTPWLAKRILENRRTGAVISYTRPWTLLFRFLSAPLVKRDAFEGFDPNA
jgi:NAD(P)-dependent dehydrogenase (short-subunit alcohol dehydrogenase family)